jgi:hypothetical protein
MEEIKAPKKERKFLKSVGNIAKVLANELVMGIARKFIGKTIDKVGNKRQGLMVAFIILASSFAFAQYPNSGNKQRLGFQTSGDGLVYRGRASDTVGIKSSGLNNAYFILDTVNNILYNYIKTKGGWKFSNGDTIIIQGVTMPFDSITFKTTKDGAVGVGEVEYNDTQGSLIQGLKGGNVTNIIGQQLHQRVNNRTGITLTKGMAVYLSGSQGNRITVAKALGITDAFSANTFGIVAESIANNQSGYVITEGLITGINTSALVEDSAVYLSPTVAGGLTSTKPQAPQHTVYIGVCVKSNAGSGELFVKIRNGQELDELHDVRITSPVNNASLYYKLNEKIWRDTTATLLVSDTASMLTPYFKKSDTTSLNLVSRFAAKLNLLDTSLMLSNYLRSGIAASTYLPLIGGTVSGTIRRQDNNYNENPNTFYFNMLNYYARRDNIQNLGQTAQITFTDRPGTYFYAAAVRTSDIHFMTAHNWNNVNYGQYLDTTLSVVANQDGGRIGINNLNPAYKLDVNGTLGVTGAATLSSTLAVTGNITEGGNNVLTNLDTVSLSSRINTKVGLTGNEIISGTKTFNNLVNIGNQMTLSGSVSGTNILLGKNTTNNGVGDVTVGTGLNLSTSNILTATGVTSVGITAPALFTVSNSPITTTGNLALTYSGTALPIANGGTGSTTASAARTALGANTLGSNLFTITNPSAITFPRFNVNNTVDALDAASFRTAIGAGTGNGTVLAVGGSNPISSSGGATPIISIAAANGTSSSGIVTTTTQVFGGDKTFTGVVGFNANIQRPIMTITGNTSILTSNCWIIVNNLSGSTQLTLPNPATSVGTELYIKTTQSQAVTSLNQVVVPLTFANTPSFNILPATDGAWCTLVSNGTYWITMQANF